MERTCKTCVHFKPHNHTAREPEEMDGECRLFSREPISHEGRILSVYPKQYKNDNCGEHTAGEWTVQPVEKG